MYPTLAVLVCQHIAVEGAHICYAIRSQPIREEDSGWQFLCSHRSAECSPVRIWAVEEIVRYDPDVLKIIDSPAGTSFFKTTTSTGSAFQKI